ncbi:MAG: bifunctional demethylmenaquinone methyltransferase/2-methoxy-6-polyprenyl-1,4-benzoquinol methylase UbiE [Micavibrio sp.]|nr:bifunctional demethylmenaquinone methyltransferase/2-methoxy-6-polyprenyl-1,4-benzoquinol methylase UbiE [Micavibrio sp.]|tara:strand:+ start:188 stop:946 length:759 start_codon:yes stop_codon:yes gene_type:complete
MTQNPESKWFGETPVEPEQKEKLVGGVFDSVAEKYDMMNDAMSFGTHRIWKDRFVSMINPRADQKFLDVAGGTGDIAFRIRKKTSPHTQITVSDINPNMLEVGRNRAIDRGYITGFDFVTANAETLPFDDNSFDTYTIAFGLRNVTHIDKALKEAHRVLKPNGTFWCLEFSHVTNPLLAKAYDKYSYNFIPKMGKIIAGDSESYQYLVESIRKHPDQENLKRRISEAGFDKSNYKNMSFGVVAVHSGKKAGK